MAEKNPLIYYSASKVIKELQAGDTIPVAMTRASYGVAGGRLTTASGSPVSTVDQTAKTIVYYTPYLSDLIGLYSGSVWNVLSFSEISAAVPSTLFRLFDIFAYNNAGVVTLETADWNQTTGAITGASNTSPVTITSTGHGLLNGDLVGIAGLVGNTAPNSKIWIVANAAANTFDLTSSAGNGVYTSGGTWYKISNTRTTALTAQNGVLVKSGAATRRYLGTGMTTGVSGQIEDSYGGGHQSGGKRFLWNYYNRVVRHLGVIDTTDSWTYTTAAFRYANNNAGNQVECVIGVVEDPISAIAITTSYSTSSAWMALGIGLNSATTNSALLHVGSAVPNAWIPIVTICKSFPSAAGYTCIVWEEISQVVGTTSWIGDNGAGAGAGVLQAGLQVEVFG